MTVSRTNIVTLSISYRQNLYQFIPKKWLVFAGDCHLINEFLETKSDKSIFILLQYLNSVLRSFGHIIYANNPISGLIIIVALASADYKAMFAGLLTSTLTFLFAKLLQQDVLGNLNGFFGYNAVLLAVISVGYLPNAYESVALNEPRFWMCLFFMTLISVYFTTAFTNLFRYLWHYPIPCFTIPFNVLQYVLIFCLLNNSIPPKILSSHLIEPSRKPNNTHGEVASTALANDSLFNPHSLTTNVFLRRRRKHEEKLFEMDDKWRITDLEDEIKNSSLGNEDSFPNETHLNWGETFSGTVTALSQVYALNDVPCSVLMYLALIIYSPTTALFCYIGSFLGTLLGVFLTSDFEKVYDGIWGYNGLLCGGALAGFGFVLTVQSSFLALIAILFCTVFQHFVTPFFVSMNVPVFHVPFVVTTVIFLLVTSDAEKALPRPGIYTFPEKHREEFRKRYKEDAEGDFSS